MNLAPTTDRSSNWEDLTRGLRAHYEPYRLGERLNYLDPAVQKRYFQLFKRIFLHAFGTHNQRDTDIVSSIYESAYRRKNASYAKSRRKRRDVFRDQSTLVYANGWFIIKAYSEMLVRVVDRVGARSVLDVGSGRGTNLVLLALQRPELNGTGLELTRTGVENSRGLLHALPPEHLAVAGYAEVDERQRQALDRIGFHQGSAFDMPFADKRFDLSYTCLVLEQMPRDWHRAVSEMRRVTSGYCVFIEPFSEANNIIGKACLRSIDYFRASYREFEKLGLEPVYFTSDFPQKVHFGVGLLVTRVRK
jgi:SAM-dependent methyltransferase